MTKKRLKPSDVRVLAKQLFGAREKAYKRLGWCSIEWHPMDDDVKRAWDAVAREAIRRLKK